MSSTSEESGKAWRVASEAVAAGMVGDELARSQGHLLEPLAVRTPEGAAGGWFVGVELEGRLLGFIQIDARGLFHRYASFQRRPGSHENCPPVGDWIDPRTILGRARAMAAPGDTLEAPVLTFDRSPDRLAWAVRVHSPGRADKTILVAGGYAYYPGESGEPSTD